MARKKADTNTFGPIKIRFKNLSKGGKSIYLECYYNGKRTYEFLNMYLLHATTPAQKTQNEQTMRSVEAIRAQRVMDLYNNKAGLSKAKEKGEITLMDWISVYVDNRAKSGKKEDKHTPSYVSSLKDYKGEKVRLGDIDKNYCLGYLDYIQNIYINPRNGAHLKPTTALCYYRFLNKVLNSAVRNEIIDKNPFNYIDSSDKIKASESQRVFLTIDEVKRLMETECRKQDVKQAFLFSCMCGLRISDIETLLWKDIHIDGESVRIDKTMVKTKRPLYLPLSDEALKWMPKRGAKNDDDLVFNLPTIATIENILHEWAKQARITKNVTFHVARHTFATMILTRGGNVYAVQKLLGHTNISTTQIYAKIVDEKKVEAVNLLNNIF